MTLATANTADKSRTDLQKTEGGVNTVSVRFLADVERQFAAELGQGPKFTAFERRLTQHMYLKVDAALKFAETKRKQGKEMTWFTVDRQKLALDTVHRVSLGLDALIPNHVHPVLYWNTHKEAYDVDLQIGYVGRDLIARRHAVEPPVQIAYELVYSTDTFRALPRSSTRDVEGYEFEIASPFDRGAIVGGFGYIVYDDARKNRLVLVTQRDFNRSKAASKSSFWRDNDVEMHLKTVVLRTASKIPVDPEKVNAAAFAAVTADDYRAPEERAEFEVEVQAAASANRQVLTLDAAPASRPAASRPAPEEPVEELTVADAGPTPEEIAEIQAREAAEASPALFEAAKAKPARRSQPGF
jgi:recombination protein RecT